MRDANTYDILGLVIIDGVDGVGFGGDVGDLDGTGYAHALIDLFRSGGLDSSLVARDEGRALAEGVGDGGNLHWQFYFGSAISFDHLSIVVGHYAPLHGKGIGIAAAIAATGQIEGQY